MLSTRDFGRLLVAGQFGLLGVLLVLPNSGAIFGPWVWPLTTALTALAVGLALAAWWSLRPAFRVHPEPRAGAPLVVAGVYRWIRHPMYTAVLLIAAAMAIGRGTWLAAGIWFALFVVLLVKSRLEDRLLRERHGQDAVAFQQQTGRFLPRLF